MNNKFLSTDDSKADLREITCDGVKWINWLGIGSKSRCVCIRLCTLGFHINRAFLK